MGITIARGQVLSLAVVELFAPVAERVGDIKCSPRVLCVSGKQKGSRAGCDEAAWSGFLANWPGNGRE